MYRGLIHFHSNYSYDSILSIKNIVKFAQKENFYGNTEIYLDNVIIAGEYGEDITLGYNFTSFEIDFNNLIPKSTYIHTPEQFFFYDTIDLLFQLNEIFCFYNYSKIPSWG